MLDVILSFLALFRKAAALMEADDGVRHFAGDMAGVYTDTRDLTMDIEARFVICRSLLIKQ